MNEKFRQRIEDHLEVASVAALERRRQRSMPDGHPDKITGYGRLYPIIPFYDAAIKRAREIRLQMRQEIITHKRVAGDQDVVKRYLDEVDGGTRIPQSESILFGGRSVRFIRSHDPYENIECDEYAFADTISEDVAVVEVAANAKTPNQRVLGGTKTVEQFIRGVGVLTVVSEDGVVQEYTFDDTTPDNARSVEVEIGQVMQWQAGESGLIFAEICEPPYKDGRFENL